MTPEDEPIAPEVGQPSKKPVKPEPPLPEPPTPEQEARAEQLVRDSSFARVKGKHQDARKLLEEAAAAAPGSAAVQEALGDNWRALGALGKARDCYRLAMRLKPGNVPAERKYAECILGIANVEDPAILLADERPPNANYASSKAAVVLSVFLPGLGHVVVGSVGRGALYITLWVLSWLMMLALPNGLSGLGNALRGGTDPVNGWVFPPLLVALIVFFASVGEMLALSKRFEAKKVDRPVPPVDKPFEL